MRDRSIHTTFVPCKSALKVQYIKYFVYVCSYGDKTVVSLPARIFTVFWTLFGLVTFGIMMGAFSAALETMTFEETKSAKMLYGTKVSRVLKLFLYAH